MTKDNSSRSSAAGSTHATPPRENGLEAPAREPQQSDEAAPNKSRSASLAADPSKSIEPDAPAVCAAESQPMTASNSNSSSPSAIEGAGSGMGAAAPYGTRSRNRTGASRPNYAEDKEIDTEFEITASSKEGRKAARGGDFAPAATTDPGRVANNARKNHVIEPDHTAAVQSHYKDPIPGTSTFSANLITSAAAVGQSSKKRKANGPPATNNLQPQTHFTTQGTLPAVTRRANNAVQAFNGSRETNMLSFDDCGSRLRDKKLFADDGTVLEVNGESKKLRKAVLLG